MKSLKFFLSAGLIASSLMCFSQNKKASKTATPEPKLATKIDSVSYAIGISIASNLKQQGFDSVNVDALNRAIKDAYKDQGKMDATQSQSVVSAYYQDMQKSQGDRNLKAGQKFLDENKKKPGVITLPSGLQYQILKEGNGPKPTAEDKVTTHYHGTLINGKVFDSSVEKGQPVTFPVNGVIKGWVEALQLMPVGSKWRLFVPANLAYGEQGAGGSIGPNSTLIFDVELISIDQ